MPSKDIQLKFLGAAGTVTGSRYLLDSGARKLLVDCGLFQGYKPLRLRNWTPFPVAPTQIDDVVLTHAHLDHSGYLPLLVKNGFAGRILCTPPTRDLCEILLRDSGHLQEREAEYANRHGFSKHKPALPLYTQEDAERSLRSFVPVAFDHEFEIASGMALKFRHAGHILGAAIAEVRAAGRSLVFSGDLGRPDSPTMLPPQTVVTADYLDLHDSRASGGGRAVTTLISELQAPVGTRRINSLRARRMGIDAGPETRQALDTAARRMMTGEP